MTLDEKLKEIPRSAGVYLYKDSAGKTIYIGKAKNLRSRVRSYFQARPFDRKTDALLRQIADVEFIVTDNEVEALILEATLTKKHKPRYNVNLKDDKSYPHLKLTINEPFPKVVITRRIQNDGALYFGPFLPASLARKTIDVINRTFQLRTCDIEIDGKAPRPCLEYHIKRCLGPCVKGLCTPQQYQEAVKDVRLLLEGRNTELADTLADRMAAGFRQICVTKWPLSIAICGRLSSSFRNNRRWRLRRSAMWISSRYYREGRRLALQLFTMREGHIVGRREFFWEDLPEDDFDPASFLSDVLAQYYTTDYVPKEIHVPVDFEDRELLEQALNERKGRRVKILHTSTRREARPDRSRGEECEAGV